MYELTPGQLLALRLLLVPGQNLFVGTGMISGYSGTEDSGEPVCQAQDKPKYGYFATGVAKIIQDLDKKLTHKRANNRRNGGNRYKSGASHVLLQQVTPANRTTSLSAVTIKIPFKI